MEIILLVIIAVTLSMDAFSLSLAYGTIGLDKKNIILLSCIVGIYHFIMPQIGNLFGILILKIIKIEPDIIIALIFTIIGIQMIIELFKEEKETFPLKISQMILFGFAVSIDSFSVGIGLNAITNKNILASSIFSIISFLFTYVGLKTGKYINEKIGKISTLIGGIIIIIFALLYLFKII